MKSNQNDNVPRACLLVVHALVRKDVSVGSASARRGSRHLQFTGARRYFRTIRAAVEAEDSQAPRAATEKEVATGTGPTLLTIHLMGPLAP